MPTLSHDVARHSLIESMVCEIIGITLLCVGGYIYITSRPATLLFVMCNKILCTNSLSLPSFVVFNLPGGLWSASYMLVMHPLVRHESLQRRIATITAIPMLGIVSELMQVVGWLPGTFDTLDLICYALPVIIYLTITQLTNHPRSL